jgi:5-methylcytosine-specific restriction endonuclease McrA
MTSKRKLWDDAYYERNKDIINVKKAIRYARNREQVRAKQAAYYQNNKHLFAQKSMKRYASKTNQTPTWLNKAHFAEMDGIYEYCKIFNQFIPSKTNKLQVDHIIPLHGKRVSGLHIPSNLQVITCKENAVKRNNF